MPNINLIQEQRAAARRRERQARGFFIGFLALSALSLIAFGSLVLMVEALRGEQANLQRQLGAIKPVADLIEANERELKALQPKLATLERARESTQKWIRILEQLSQSVPPQTYLTALRSSQPSPQDPLVITIAGVGANQSSAADLLASVQRIENLENVALRYTQGRETDEGVSIEFEIEAELAGSAQPKVDKPKSEDGS